MALSGYQRIAYRVFGGFAEDRARANDRLRTVLM